MGVINLNDRVDKLEESTASLGSVTDQIDAEVTALDEQINGDGETDLGLAGAVTALNEQINGDGDTDLGLAGDVADLSAALPNEKTLVLASSTASSTKKFAITVLDNGTISATEITE